ncbi:MAG: hypothetical protein OXP69_06190 [Spirochaetaceae bacterium]|nr:hypothetical protein [Spirochaetaceae bacterium]
MGTDPGRGQRAPAVVVTDASVLLNFLGIDRMDLLSRHSAQFVITDHVAAEVADQYPEQQQRFGAALRATVVVQKSVRRPEEISLFRELSASGRLGAGECSAIAMATYRHVILAIDDRQATAQARRLDPTLRVLTTKDLMVSMIREGVLDIAEADQIKDEWAARHRFRLKLRSFREICN